MTRWTTDRLKSENWLTRNWSRRTPSTRSLAVISTTRSSPLVSARGMEVVHLGIRHWALGISWRWAVEGHPEGAQANQGLMPAPGMRRGGLLSRLTGSTGFLGEFLQGFEVLGMGFEPVDAGGCLSAGDGL